MKRTLVPVGSLLDRELHPTAQDFDLKNRIAAAAVADEGANHKAQKALFLLGYGGWGAVKASWKTWLGLRGNQTLGSPLRWRACPGIVHDSHFLSGRPGLASHQGTGKKGGQHRKPRSKADLACGSGRRKGIGKRTIPIADRRERSQTVPSAGNCWCWNTTDRDERKLLVESRQGNKTGRSLSQSSALGVNCDFV